jgi:hypothetical protein
MREEVVYVLRVATQIHFQARLVFVFVFVLIFVFVFVFVFLF